MVASFDSSPETELETFDRLRFDISFCVICDASASVSMRELTTGQSLLPRAAERHVLFLVKHLASKE